MNTDDQDQISPIDQNIGESEKSQPKADHPLDEEAGMSEEQNVEKSESQNEPEKPEQSQPKADRPLDEEDQNTEISDNSDLSDNSDSSDTSDTSDTPGRWYVVHTYSGHENRVATSLKQRIESEHMEGKIIDVLVPTQEKIEIRGGKKETVKEKIFPGYILVKMVLDDESWLVVRTTQGVTSFIGMSNKPTPISDREVKSIVAFMQQGGQPTYKQVYSEGDTVKIVDGPFAEFIGKIDSVDKERGKVKVLVSIFGRETPVELDFLQIAKL